MSNYYCNTQHEQPEGMCYITQPCYEQGDNVWAQCEYCGVCYNVFLTPRDSYGGGVDLNQCKKEITRHGKYSDFLRVFDWALQLDEAPAAYCINGEGVSWLGNACCSYTNGEDVADAYNYAESPVADYCNVCNDEYYYDWYAFRCDHDFAMAINPFWRERMRDQMDYLSVYGNWKDADNSGSTYFCLCDCRGACYTYCACNGGAWLCIDGVKSLTECGATEQGWVIPYMRPYTCAYLCMSCRGDNLKIYSWGGEPYDGGGYSCVCCGSVTCTDIYHCSCCVCYGQGSCQVCCGSVEVCTGQYCCGMIDNGTCYDVTGVTTDFCGIIVDFGTATKAVGWGNGINYVVTAWYDNDAGGLCGAVNFKATYPDALAAQCSCDVLYSWATQAHKGICGIMTICHTANTICDSIFKGESNGDSCFWVCAFDPLYNTWNPDKIGVRFYGGNSTPQYCLYDTCSWQDVCCTCNYDLYCTCNYDVCCTYQCDVYVCTPKDGSLYIWREPCETDGVLYFGLPNYAIGSIPIKRIKCTIDNTPSVSYMRNESSRAECWSARDMAFVENSNKYKFCFITFPNSDESLIDNVPKMMSCAIWYYLCSYKCEAGQYVAMCKSSVNVLNRDMCGAKMTYYSFQGYSIGGAYL